jgi:hypothetical protein
MAGIAGCSLNDAFPDNTEKAGKIARKEERKKAAICKGPALSFLKGADESKDPDRVAAALPPPPEKMQGSMINKESKNVNSTYFGKGENEESFANFSPHLEDNPGYKLQPDFLASFQAAGLGKASGVPLGPSNQWKGFGPMSNDTIPQQSETPMSNDDKILLQKKIDTLFARLESMECQSGENVNTEIALFILSGLFLLFGLETLRKFR